MNMPLAVTVGGQNEVILRNRTDLVKMMRESVALAQRPAAAPRIAKTHAANDTGSPSILTVAK
jgi:hypothetical protein